MNAIRRLAAASAAALAILAAMPPAPALALRANLRNDLARLEKLGHYDEVLFYRLSTMRMVLAVHAAWDGAAYDPAMDGALGMTETRTDRRYLNLVNSQKRPVSALLAKAGLTAAQRELLDLRVRVYVEGHMSPEFDEMGNFHFRRKAGAMEQMGLFRDAAYRRRLTGYYWLRVCREYYLTMAEKFSRAGRAALGKAYRDKAGWCTAQALREFRRCNGDRAIAGIQGGNVRSVRRPDQTFALLRKALAGGSPDAGFAAACVLGEMGRFDALTEAARTSTDVEVRLEAARAFAEGMHLSGLTIAAADADPRVRQAAEVWRAAPGERLRAGIVARYFSVPGKPPAAEKVLPAADIGLDGNERWPARLRPGWVKPSVIPPTAKGQFLVRFAGKLRIPAGGAYRFYVKTDRGRATIRLGGRAVISPANDRRRLYAVQSAYGRGELNRIDFSEPVEMKTGLADVLIEYQGRQVRGQTGTAGLRLYWSSDERVMEPVPASAFWHERK